MRQVTERFEVTTAGRGLLEITATVDGWLRRSGVAEGLITLFCRHTSASLLIQENADPDVRSDLEAFFARIAPEDFPYRHDAEGPDDMPAHVRSALTAQQLSIPVLAGRMALGTWQGIYLFEHRRRTGARWSVICSGNRVAGTNQEQLLAPISRPRLALLSSPGESPMPDGALHFSPMHCAQEGARRPLAEAVGMDRHLRARCPCCRAVAVLDAKTWIDMRLGGQPLLSFEERLRCVCGSRRASLEIWPGAVSSEARSDIWIFR